MTFWWSALIFPIVIVSWEQITGGQKSCNVLQVINTPSERLWPHFQQKLTWLFWRILETSLSTMNVGTAHSEVNPNTRVMNSRGMWLSYILGIGLLHVILLSIPFASVPVVWTLTNLIHNLVSAAGGAKSWQAAGKYYFCLKLWSFFLAPVIKEKSTDVS